MIAAKLIYKSGLALRNPRIMSRLTFLETSQGWSLEELRQWQLERLQALVRRAYDLCPFYRERFAAQRVGPGDIRSLHDLEKLPFLTKADLLQHVDQIQLRDLPQRHFYSETSGSTGQPLVFYRNQDWDAWHRASVFRGYSWYGVQPWNRNGYLWGYNFASSRRRKTALLDLLQNRFRLFSYHDREIEQFARKLRKACFLSGYSSMIYEVAKAINRCETIAKPIRLRLVKGTSEKIYDKYQEEARLAFGQKIVSEYGAAEAGIIAFECPQGNMHVNMETCIVETDNGQIVVTNLVSDSVPIIRYRLGDYVDYDPLTRCACGRQHQIIREVTGRIGKPIYGRNEKYPSLTLYYVFKNLAMEHDILLNYQAVQDEPGSLELLLEGTLEVVSRRILNRELRKYFGDDLEVRISENVDLRSSTRKKQDFVSSLA